MKQSMVVNGDQIAERFSQRLRLVRSAQEMSQGTLAARASSLGVTLLQSTIAKIEAGQRAVRIDEAWALASALDVRLDAMVGPGTGPDASPEHLRRLKETLDAQLAFVAAELDRAEQELVRANEDRARALELIPDLRTSLAVLTAENEELAQELERRAADAKRQEAP